VREHLPVLAVLGGTGAQGTGLALRWARAGYQVIIGSRDPDRAGRAAVELNAELEASRMRGMDNRSAAEAAGIVILTVPYAAQIATLEQVREALAGKILVDVTVPLVPPRVARVQLPGSGSAAVAAQRFLGEGVTVVSAFHNVSAQHLRDPEHPIECDVLVCGDAVAAREQVITLARAAGMRGVHGGPLANSAAPEALTSVLIAINRRYKVAGAGIRITGLPEATGG
jgi:NADPH-dependent F420 reductase